MLTLVLQAGGESFRNFVSWLRANWELEISQARNIDMAETDKHYQLVFVAGC
jgi:hypothetical protein